MKLSKNEKEITYCSASEYVCLHGPKPIDKEIEKFRKDVRE